MDTVPFAEFIARRTELIKSAEPGTAATRSLSDLTDGAVSALAEAAFASSGIRWGLLALGAYGSQRLLPYSDLDLLVVVKSDPRSARDAVQAVLYPLWDAGFEVGHAVRTRKDHVRACAEDIATLTATLTGRHLAGDIRLSEELLSSAAASARKRSSAILKALATRLRTGSPYDLEPDLKEGAGGQRDIDELTWRTAIATGARAGRPDSAAAPDVLGMAECAELAIAQDHLSAARWHLHCTAGRKRAVLDVDTAESTPSGGAALHTALATINEQLLAVRGVLSSDDLHPTSWSPDALLDAIAQGGALLPSIETAARRGALETLAPGMSNLMTLRRPALSHRFTVGAHSLLATTLAAGLPATDALAGSLTISPGMRLAIVAACLMHDAGKVVPGAGHAERSEPIAAATARALGADQTVAAIAGTLAREHLLLAETASTADIDDENVVLKVAARIAQRDLVGPLYVLTAADSMATGPSSWDAWHASLVRTLAARLDAALANDVDGAGMVAAAELIRRAALDLAPDEPTAALVRNAPVRFLTARSAGEAAADAQLVVNLGPRHSREQVALRVSSVETPGTYRLAIATYDRPGVFATLTGAIALGGLDILGATALSISGDTVLDTFTVVSSTLAEIGPETWTTLERHLSAALDGHLDLAVRLGERRRHYPPHAVGGVRVETHTDSVFSTALRIGAPDRPGLLFDIADEITRAGLTITRVNARTRDARARDTFHVVDADGLAPDDPGALGHLAMRVRERLNRS